MYSCQFMTTPSDREPGRPGELDRGSSTDDDGVADDDADDDDADDDDGDDDDDNNGDDDDDDVDDDDHETDDDNDDDDDDDDADDDYDNGDDGKDDDDDPHRGFVLMHRNSSRDLCTETIITVLRCLKSLSLSHHVVAVEVMPPRGAGP